MPRDTQGNPHHSFGRARLQDDMEKDKKMQHASKAVDPKSREMGKQPDPDAEMRDESPEDIHDVVMEHGPAVEIHAKHDHEAGVHQVTTHHGEHSHGHEEGHGFTHHSRHSTAEAAHEHMKHALGMAEHEKGETPEYESREESEQSIPGLA